MDCFDYIQKNRHGTVKHMHVWDGSSDSFISFHGQEDNLAIIVENDLIQASLSNDLDKVDNLNIFYSSQVKDFNSNSQNVNLKLNDGKEINTKLLIGSDGANSFIRNKSEFKVTKWDYDQVAIVATVKLEEVTIWIKDSLVVDKILIKFYVNICRGWENKLRVFASTDANYRILFSLIQW